MKIENKVIEAIHSSELGNGTYYHLTNSVIHLIDFDLFEPRFNIVIENCVIHTLRIHSCWFKNGLGFKNNNVTNYIDYQMGGHNGKPKKLIGNIFNDFVNFFDCHFDNPVELKNNVFHKGCNLLGNVDEGFKNIFNAGVITEGNIGRIDVNGFGR